MEKWVQNQNQGSNPKEPPIVALMEATNGFHAVQEIMAMADSSHYFSCSDKIMVKPTYAFIPKAGSFTTVKGDIEQVKWAIGTHPSVLSGALEYLINKLGIPKENITVAEGSRRGAYQEKYAFPFFGGDEVVHEYGVSITDMNVGDRFYSYLSHSLSTRDKWSVHSSVLGKKVLMLPKLRAHEYVTFTCAMKNLMAFIMPRYIVHDDIHRRIVDLNMIKEIDIPFVIADGIQSGVLDKENCLEHVNFNLLVAGNSTASVDAVIAYLLGMNPEDIGFLRFAKKRGFVIDIDKIDIRTEVGKTLDSYKRNFVPREELVDGCRVASFLEEFPDYEKDYGSTVVKGGGT